MQFVLPLLFLVGIVPTAFWLLTNSCHFFWADSPRDHQHSMRQDFVWSSGSRVIYGHVIFLPLLNNCSNINHLLAGHSCLLQVYSFCSLTAPLAVKRLVRWGREVGKAKIDSVDRCASYTLRLGVFIIDWMIPIYESQNSGWFVADQIPFHVTCFSFWIFGSYYDFLH